MTCETCGEKPKKCGNCNKDFPRAVIEINNPEALVLLRKVVIPTSMGTEEQVPAVIGKYHNVVLYYEANKHVYLYSSDGIPTAITADIPQEVLDSIAELEGDVDSLQQQIDDLKNSPDVVDIVDTYADLQAYDTSHLGDKDIIRVLADETHDEASSYYRWDKETETWTYIGSVQTAINTIFYADLSETGNTHHIYKNSDMTGTVSVQELLDANEDGQVILRMSSAQTPENFNDAYLQNTYVGVSDYQFLFLDNRNYYEYDGTATTDTSYYYSKSTIQLELTAGNNITITGNTISATDTTYSNFIGTDGTSAGTAGLVPAPATTDAGKVLGADGTWTQNGHTVVQTAGTSTTDVMSQYASTALIYPSYAYNSDRIRIGSAATATSSYAVAIGDEAKASAKWSTALGSAARANGDGSIAISGGSANSFGIARGPQSIAIGYNAGAGSGTVGEDVTGAIALGAGALAMNKGEMNIGSSYISYGYNNSNYRLLTGLYDPQSAHDAATKGYVDNIVVNYAGLYNAGAPTTSTIAYYLGQFYYDTTNDDIYYCSNIDTTDPNNPVYTWTALPAGGGGGPTVVQTTGTSTTDVMSQASTSQMIFPSGFEISKDRIAVGDNAAVSATKGIAIGQRAVSSHAGSIAIGHGAITHVAGEVSINSAYNTSYGYNNTPYRLLTGLHDPVNAHDAVTKGYVDPSTDTTAPTSSTTGRLGEIRIDTSTNTAYMCVSADSISSTYTWKQITS